MLKFVGFAERAVLLKMPEVLEYFANVLGERMSQASFGGLDPSANLLSL